MADNPLVKTDGDDSSALNGAGIVQDFYAAAAACSDGNWAEGLLNAGFGAAGVAEFVADPIAGLASAGIGWLIEHVSFLREPLDWLTGDGDALENMAGTWENIGKEMEAIGADLRKEVDRYEASWTGEGADAYRAFAKDRADTYAGVATGANAVSKLVSMCKMILSAVRTIVRDLISECVGKLISIACRYAGPQVVAGTVAEGVPTAVKYGNKCIQWINKLVRVFNKAKGLFKRLTDIFEKAKKALTPKGLQKFVGGAKGTTKGASGEFDFAKAVTKTWDEGPKTAREVFEEAGTKITSDFTKEFKKEYAKEKWKERGKKVDAKLGDDDPEVATPRPSPIFDEPSGGRRISGTIE